MGCTKEHVKGIDMALFALLTVDKFQDSSQGKGGEWGIRKTFIGLTN